MERGGEERGCSGIQSRQGALRDGYRGSRGIGSFHYIFSFGGEADGEDHAEVERGGFETERDAVAAEGILLGIP
jgi:hypothetical protein